MRLTDEEKQTLVERYKSGTTASSICAEAGIARSTFYSWVKPYGVLLEKDNQVITLRELDKRKKHTEKLESIVAVLKTANCSVSSPLQEKLSEMEALHGQFSVHVLCDALNVPRGTFYNHIFRNKGENTLKAARREDFRGIIREIFDDSNQLFGAEKITSVLQSRGFKVGKKFVLQLMREMSLYSISPISKREYIRWSKGENQNIIQQQFNPMQPNEIWASDITQFRLHQQTYYICAILDLFSRKVIAYRISKSQSTQLVTLTFKQAYLQRIPSTGLIFHSDRGSQYLSKAFRNLLADNNVIQSLSRPGKPHDNAVMESFFAILKKEELYRHNYKSQTGFIQSFNHYMKFYNSQRPHSTLQYKTPDAMEESFLKQEKPEP